MRLHVAVVMPEKGGRPVVAAVEVLLRHGVDQRRRWHYEVGLVERVRQQTIEGARERARGAVLAVTNVFPCLFVDVGTPQGLALRRSLKREWPEALHRPHAYQRTTYDSTGFATLLEAYADGRVRFLGGLDHQKELDRALVLYRGGVGRKSVDDLESEDEALVQALALAMMFPSHGSEPRRLGEDPVDVAPAPAGGMILGTMKAVRPS